MRALSFVLLGSLLFLAIPGVANASESFGCHTWDIFVGDRTTGAGASADTAVYAGANGVYVVSDGAPAYIDPADGVVLNPWLFSVWVYQEANGVPGMQRSDEVCDETNGGEIDCDCTLP